jgi:hypothetical protein
VCWDAHGSSRTCSYSCGSASNLTFFLEVFEAGSAGSAEAMTLQISILLPRLKTEKCADISLSSTVVTPKIWPGHLPTAASARYDFFQLLELASEKNNYYATQGSFDIRIVRQDSWIGVGKSKYQRSCNQVEAPGRSKRDEIVVSFMPLVQKATPILRGRHTCPQTIRSSSNHTFCRVRAQKLH